MFREWSRKKTPIEKKGSFRPLILDESSSTSVEHMGRAGFMEYSAFSEYFGEFKVLLIEIYKLPVFSNTVSNCLK